MKCSNCAPTAADGKDLPQLKGTTLAAAFVKVEGSFLLLH
jgi:hypothetical protein